jgi:hypothetical protein
MQGNHSFSGKSKILRSFLGRSPLPILADEKEKFGF